VQRDATLFEFRARLLEARERLASLRSEPPPPAEPIAEALASERALVELDTAWEELQVADEELRAQGDELEQAARDLEREQSRYRQLFELAPEPYLRTDALGKVTHANRAAAALLRVPAHKLPGRLLVSFVRLGERGSFRERLGAVTGSGAGAPPMRWEGTLCPAGSREPPPEVSAAVAASGDGEGGVLWSVRDVTERRRYEAGLAGLNAELERRVVERTAELEASRRAVEGLLVGERRARREAQRAAGEREAFVALVSHELRTPLHAVLGWVRLAREGQAGEGGPGSGLLRALAVVERNARAMASLVDDLLDLARLERGELRLARERLEAGELARAVAAGFEPEARERGVALEVRVESGECWVEGDRGRLEQAAGNLVANALKFTPRGGRVEVVMGRAEGGALLRVCDTGCGIAAGLLPHVFERYRQGEGGLQGQGRGLGLGLAIVRKVVERHGGRVEAASEGQGRGATFTLWLPAAASRDVAPPAAGESAADEGRA
jgi:PAS domain S-box-containing protein